MKKGTTTAVAFALSFCTSVFAGEVIEATPKPNGCEGSVLCPAHALYGSDANGDSRSGWHFEVGFLYQQPRIQGTVSGARSVANIFPNGTTIFSGEQTIEDLNESFDYSPGLTVGLGYIFDHDSWFLKADFDWLYSSVTNRIHDDSDTFYYLTNSINPTVGYLADICFASRAEEGVWLTDLVYNAEVDIYALDVALSRGSYHSSNFSLEPFTGVKGLWYIGNYGSTTGPTGSGVSGLYSEFGITTYFHAWGVGPMFGFNSEYFITEGFSIFSDSDIGLLYGAMIFRVNAAGTVVSPPPEEICNNLNSYQRSAQEFYVPVRTILGFKSGTDYSDGKNYLAIKVGYDIRYVFARSIMPDLGMSGLYLGLIWDF